MKKISLLLSTLLISCTFTFKDLGAEAHPKEEGFTEGMLQAIPVPVYCAPTFQLLTAIMDTFSMRYVIGTSSFWYNEKTKKGIMSLTMVDTGLTCMMSYGINFKFDEGMMLNIINEEMK